MKFQAGRTLFMHPQSGQYHVRVVDDHGRFDTTIMQVLLAQ
jgi:hypothetical protein